VEAVSSPSSQGNPTPQPGPAPVSTRSIWRRITGAQESGLVLVIILIGLGLTIFGGTKLKTTIVDLTPDAQVTTQADGAIVVNDDAGTRTYAAGQWRLSETSRGRRLIGPKVRVNKFLDIENLVLVAKDASFIAIMAVGMTAVIILAGIDLSVGSIYALAAIIGAMALHELDGSAGLMVSLPLALLVCMAVGALCGLANGVMIVGLRVHPFVITLGMMAALRGLTTVLPNEIYHTQSIGHFPESFTRGFFKAEIAGVYPVPVLVMIVVAIIGVFVLSRTVFGRQVYATGGNETAAYYAGIPVGRVKIIVYTIMGLLSGLSACVYLGYLGAAETSAGNAYELRVIAAAVIGGASLMGGRGSALGAVLGAIVIELIGNAMIILDIKGDYYQIVMGAAIIIAVVIDQTKTRLAAKNA
jgi:ribose/xylose/arabinose/galactoside ABC-type transport system permease subunit